MTPFLYPIHAQTAAIRMAGYALTKQIELFQAMSRLATLSPVASAQTPSASAPQAKPAVKPVSTRKAVKVQPAKPAPVQKPKTVVAKAASVAAASSPEKPAAAKRKPVAQTTKRAAATTASAASVTKATPAKSTRSAAAKSPAAKAPAATQPSAARPRRAPSRPPSMPRPKSQTED